MYITNFISYVTKAYCASTVAAPRKRKLAKANLLAKIKASPPVGYSTSIISASDFLRESSYPRTVSSIGSPRGATLRT